MAGTPNGVSATPAGCAPYFPVFAYDHSGWICVPNVVAGVRSNLPEANVCTEAGFGWRAVGGADFGACVEQKSVVAGDVVQVGSGSTSVALATSICQAQGYGVSTSGGNQVCSGARSALAVTDTTNGGKLDTVHTDLQGVTSAVKTGTNATVTVAPPTSTSVGSESFAIQPVMGALFAPVLFALLVALLWTFWKQLAR